MLMKLARIPCANIKEPFPPFENGSSLNAPSTAIKPHSRFLAESRAFNSRWSRALDNAEIINSPDLWVARYVTRIASCETELYSI